MTWMWPAVLLLLPLCLLPLLPRRNKSVPVADLRIWRRVQSEDVRRYNPALPLLMLGMVCLLVALARPRREQLIHETLGQGIAIEMLLDCSSSMETFIQRGEERISRMDAARDILQRFVTGDGDALNGRKGDLLGLVTFARYADTRCPLTSDHHVLASILDDLDVETRPHEDGTAYGDALALAAARLKYAEDHDSPDAPWGQVSSKVIVLLTDGENNCGRRMPEEAGALARRWGYRIYAISIVEPPRIDAQHVDGQEFLDVPPESEAARTLRSIAELSGGIYREVSDYDALESIYGEIDELEKSELKQSPIRVMRPFYMPWAVAAFVFLFAAGLWSATIGRVLP